MGISHELFQHALEDGEIVISPLNMGYLGPNNTYELHNNGYLSFYDYEEIYNFGVAIDSEDPPEPFLVENEIPSNGWCLEPTKVYLMTLKETIVCPHFTTHLSVHPDLAKLGLSITTENMPAYARSAQEFNIRVTVVHPIVIYPEQRIAQLTMDPGDVGTSAIPIGGIIEWWGKLPLPYGFCYCDGSHGSPALVGNLIRGATKNKYLGPIGDVCHPVETEYDLIFIMRYK